MQSKNYFENLYLDQQHNVSFIYKYCMMCSHHSKETQDNKIFHMCNDNWSNMKVGNHIFYCETKDVCVECNGFDSIGMFKKD